MSRSWAEGKTKEYLALNANGTGPYKVVRFVPEQVAELERNEKWWGGSVGFKRIVLRFVREVAPRLALGQAGQADVIAALDPDLAPEAEKAGMNVVVANTRGPGFVALSNLDDHNVMDPSKPNPLKDIRVRQALNYAIDRETIIKNILKGMAFPMRSWVPQPAMRGYVDPKELTPFTYNPDKAKQLLRDAGYAQGFKNRIIHPEKQWSKVDEIALAIVDQLSEYGIQTKVEPLPGPIWVETFFGSKTAPMHLELGWPTPLDPWLFPDLMTGQFKWFRDAELRQIFDDSFKLTLEETDKGLRRLTKKTWEACPVIWLWHPAQIWAASPQVFWPEEGTNTQISLFRAKPKT